MSTIKNIKTNRLFLLSLVVSVLFFLAKGIQYVAIGSYVPLVFIFSVLIGFYLSYNKSVKAFGRMTSFWAVLIIVWALVRLIFWIYLEIDNNLTESHLREQFGLWENLLSIIMLVIGVVLIRQFKQQKQLFKKS